MKEHTYELATMPTPSNPSGIIASGLSEAALFDYLSSQFISFQSFSDSLSYRLGMKESHGTATFIMDANNTFKAAYGSNSNRAYAFITKEKA